MGIDFAKFLNSLPYMGYGMLGIFIVTGVIILTVYLLNFLTNRPKKEEK